MAKQEKEQLLKKLKQDLEEVEAERKFVLSQTGHHVSSKTKNKYKDEVFILRKRIKELEDALSL